MSDDLIHISSAVVSVLPAQRDQVTARLAELTETDIHFGTDSKIIIVMEAASSGILGSKLAEIATWPGVLSANMVFERVARLADIGE